MAADYYAILKNAIGALPESSGEARRAVYEKARRAVVDQLKSFEPPLSATEITQERLRLEDCIRRVESEAAKGILTQTLGRAVNPPAPPPPPAYREPETRSRQTYDPQPRAYEPPSRSLPAPDRMPSRALPPPPQQEPTTGYGYERPTQERTRMGGQPNGYAPAQQQAPAYAPPAYAPPQQGYAPPQQHHYDQGSYGGQALRQAVHEADQLGAAVAETAQHARETLLASQEGYPALPVDEPATTQTRARMQASAAPADGELPFGERRRSRKPLYIALFVGVLVIGLGVVALWSQHERIATYFGVQKSFGIGTARTDTGGGIAPKSTDRLGSDDPAAAKPDSGIKAVQTQQIVPPVVPQPAPQAQAQPKPAQVQPPQPVLPPVGPVAQINPPAGNVPPQPPAQQPVPLVAQKVTLMEEGPAGITQPLFSSGKVVWQLVKESPAAGKPPVAVVRARIEVPDRKIVLAMSIQPNADATLPASHVIELRFTVPPDFDGKGVGSVPGLIMKPTEQATGQPLSAASAKISSGFFLIALTANDPDRSRNLTALKDSGWLSVPVVYDNGKRGLISIEKSGAGDKVLTDAFAAWGQ